MAQSVTGSAPGHMLGHIAGHIEPHVTSSGLPSPHSETRVTVGFVALTGVSLIA
jgi:hypothetical protein